MIWASALVLYVDSNAILREMEQKISLSFRDIHKTPACFKDFSNAEIYFITGKHQQGPQGLDHLKTVCWKGHLNDIIKLEERADMKNNRRFLISGKEIYLELDLFLYWLFLLPLSLARRMPLKF